MERVPENVDAAKELLQYGLKGTDLEALIAIGKGVDDGRLVLEVCKVTWRKLRLQHWVRYLLSMLSKLLQLIGAVFPFS